MKKTLLKRTLRVIGAVLLALSALGLLALGAILLAPAVTLPFLAESGAGLAGVPLRIGGMSGNFLEGFVIQEVSAGLPSADVAVQTVVVDARWRSLAVRRLSLERLEMDGLVVRLKEAPPEKKEKPEGGKKGTAWRFSIDRVRLSGGAILQHGRALREIEVRAALPEGRLVVTRARAILEDSELRLRGGAAFAPAGAWLVAGATGPLDAELRLRGAERRWTLDGRGRFRGAFVRIAARVDGESWRADAAFRGVDPAWFGTDAVKGPLSGDAAAHGQGTHWPPASAQVSLRLNAAAQKLFADARLREGTVAWLARLAGDVTGRASGTCRADGGVVAGSWKLTARRPELERWAGAGGEVGFSGRLRAMRGPEGWSARGRDLRLTAGPNLDFEAEFIFTRNVLNIPRLAWRTPGGELVAYGTVPFSSAGERLPDFDVSLRARSVSLAFVAAWLSDAEIEDGLLDADLHLAHRRGVFLPEGSIHIRAARLKGTPAGLDLKDISLRAVAERNVVRIAEGRALTKKGEVGISGSLNAHGPDLALTAARLAFRVPGDVAGLVNGNLSLGGRWKALTVKGDIGVSEADYIPAKKKKKKDAKEEKKAPAPPSSPGALAMDLRMHFDRNVWYKDGSNYIELKGDLRVRKQRQESAALSGRVETLRGQYGLYGRTFVIQSGRAIFHGETPIDPALAVRALYLEENSGTKVFLDVGGTASRPTLTLSSLPPLEEQDILSLLAFGRPLDGGKEADGSGAAQSLVANYLLQQTRNIPLIRRLDLDILQVRKSAAGDTDLTVGRYLSRDLFVSYDQTLGDDGQRRLNAEYTFTPHWSLFGRRSNGSQYIIDLLFKYGVR